MKRFLVLSGLCLLFACGGSDTPTGGRDGGGTDGGVSACLDRPTDLPRAPDAGLPCDLIPPR